MKPIVCPSVHFVSFCSGDEALYRGCQRKTNGELHTFLHFADRMKYTVWVKTSEFEVYDAILKRRNRVSRYKRRQSYRINKEHSRLRLGYLQRDVISLAEKGNDIGQIAVKLFLRPVVVKEIIEQHVNKLKACIDKSENEKV